MLRRVFDPIREYSSVSIKRGSHKVISERITTAGTSMSPYENSYDRLTYPQELGNMEIEVGRTKR